MIPFTLCLCSLFSDKGWGHIQFDSSGSGRGGLRSAAGAVVGVATVTSSRPLMQYVHFLRSSP